MFFNGIKNIIFDLGGVILDIDYNLTVKAFEKLGIPNFKAQYSKMSQSNLFDNIETGKINPEEFRNLIRVVAEKDVTDAEIDHAWNALILHLTQYRIEILKKLQNNYRLFLLSNTNKIHYDANSFCNVLGGFERIGQGQEVMHVFVIELPPTQVVGKPGRIDSIQKAL